MRFIQRFIIAIGLLGLMTVGCATSRSNVRYKVLLPSEIKLPNVNRIAILDFAVLHRQDTFGQEFSAMTNSLFEEQSHYRMVPPMYSRKLIRHANIPLSRFRNADIIRKMGDAMNAHALFFGDMSVNEIQRFEKKEKIMRQIGVQKEKETIVDAHGNTQSFWREIPLFKEIARHTINRIASVQARGRMVRVHDAMVMWEGESEGQALDEVTYEEGASLQYQQSSDENLRLTAMQRAAKSLVEDFFPKQVIRERQLAVLNDESKYAKLIHSGNLAAQKKDWNQAGRFWLKAMNVDKERSEAYANLAILHEGAQAFQQAFEYYQYAADRLGEPWKTYLAEIAIIIQQP